MGLGFSKSNKDFVRVWLGIIEDALNLEILPVGTIEKAIELAKERDLPILAKTPELAKDIRAKDSSIKVFTLKYNCWENHPNLVIVGLFRDFDICYQPRRGIYCCWTGEIIELND